MAENLRDPWRTLALDGVGDLLVEARPGFVVDADTRRLVFANAAGRRFLGLAPQAPLDTATLEPRLAERLARFAERADTGAATRELLRLRDGLKTALLALAFRRPAAGGPVVVLVETATPDAADARPEANLAPLVIEGGMVALFDGHGDVVAAQGDHGAVEGLDEELERVLDDAETSPVVERDVAAPGGRRPLALVTLGSAADARRLLWIGPLIAAEPVAAEAPTPADDGTAEAGPIAEVVAPDVAEPIADAAAEAPLSDVDAPVPAPVAALDTVTAPAAEPVAEPLVTEAPAPIAAPVLDDAPTATEAQPATAAAIPVEPPIAPTAAAPLEALCADTVVEDVFVEAFDDEAPFVAAAPLAFDAWDDDTDAGDAAWIAHAALRPAAPAASVTVAEPVTAEAEPPIDAEPAEPIASIAEPLVDTATPEAVAEATTDAAVSPVETVAVAAPPAPLAAAETSPPVPVEPETPPSSVDLPVIAPATIAAALAPTATAETADITTAPLPLVATAPSDEAAPEIATASSGTETTDTDGFRFEPPGRAVKFVWLMDADRRFTLLSPELAQVVGPAVTRLVGRSWSEIAKELGFDGDGVIAEALARRDTWSGRTVLWPIEGEALRVPIDLAALPAFDRGRVFAGFRGFGTCRADEPVPDPTGAGLRLRSIPQALAAALVPALPAPDATTRFPIETAAPEAPIIEALPHVEVAPIVEATPLGEPTAYPDDAEAALLADHADATDDEATEAAFAGEIADAPIVEAPVADTPAVDAPAPAADLVDTAASMAPAVAERPADVFAPTETTPSATAAAKIAAIPADVAAAVEALAPIAAPIAPATIEIPDVPTSIETAVATATMEPETAAATVASEAAVEPDARPPAVEAITAEAAPVATPAPTVTKPAPTPTRIASRTVADTAAIAAAVAAFTAAGAPKTGPARADAPLAPIRPSVTPPTAPPSTAVPPAAPVATTSVPAPAPVPGPADRVVALGRAAPDAKSDNPRLSPPERVAFHQIAEALGARLEGEPAAAPAVPSATADTVTPPAAILAPEPLAEEVSAPAVETVASAPETIAPPVTEPEAPTTPLEAPAPTPVAEAEPVLEAAAVAAEPPVDTTATPPVDAAIAAPRPIDSRLLDRLPLAVAVIKDDTLAYANERFLAMLRYPDLATLEAVGGLDSLFAGEHVARRWEGGESGRPMPLIASDGTVVPAEANLTTIPWADASALMLTLNEVAPVPAGSGLPAALVEPSPAPAAPVEPPVVDVATALAALPSTPEPEPAAPSNVVALPTPALAVVASGTPPEAARISELEAIVDTATDGVLMLDADGIVLSANTAAEALFGTERRAMIGRSLTERLAPESRRSAMDYLDGLARNGVASVLNDGREVIGAVQPEGLIPLFMTIGNISTGPVKKYCAVLRDITQWKKAEEDLNNARRRAEEASVHKSDFLAKISHEIRTPLNAIIGFSELMMDERFGPVGNDRYKDYLRDIHVSGTHIMSLVNDLLDLSKVEAGKMDLRFEAVTLADIVSECVAMMQPQANRERIIIRSSLPIGVPPVVADPRSVRQVVLNLLSNAIKFTPAGGQVIVSTTLEDNGEVVLRVRDTGYGMTDKEMQTAMEPFRQLHTTRSRAGGTGLGLPLTKALVEANRAVFRIDSTVGQGTLVSIAFPVTRVLAS